MQEISRQANEIKSKVILRTITESTPLPSTHLVCVSRGSQADIKNHHHVPAMGCPMATTCPCAGALCHLSISCTLVPFTPFAQQPRIQPGHSLVIDSLFPRLSVLYFTLTVISLNSPHYQGGYSNRKGGGDTQHLPREGQGQAAKPRTGWTEEAERCDRGERGPQRRSKQALQQGKRGEVQKGGEVTEVSLGEEGLGKSKGGL